MLWLSSLSLRTSTSYCQHSLQVYLGVQPPEPDFSYLNKIIFMTMIMSINVKYIHLFIYLYFNLTTPTLTQTIHHREEDVFMWLYSNAFVYAVLSILSTSYANVTNTRPLHGDNSRCSCQTRPVCLRIDMLVKV